MTFKNKAKPKLCAQAAEDEARVVFDEYSVLLCMTSNFEGRTQN